jgi:type II secretory pathway component HofQ
VRIKPLFSWMLLFLLVALLPANDLSGANSLPIADSIVVESLNIKNTEIRDLLQGMAVQYGLNLFLAPEVKGTVSVNFNKQPLKEALQVLLAGNGYEYVVEKGVIHVRKPRPKEPEKPAVIEKRFVVEWTNNTLSVDV